MDPHITNSQAEVHSRAGLGICVRFPSVFVVHTMSTMAGAIQFSRG